MLYLLSVSKKKIVVLNETSSFSSTSISTIVSNTKRWWTQFQTRNSCHSLLRQITCEPICGINLRLKKFEMKMKLMKTKNKRNKKKCYKHNSNNIKTDLKRQMQQQQNFKCATLLPQLLFLRWMFILVDLFLFIFLHSNGIFNEGWENLFK